MTKPKARAGKTKAKTKLINNLSEVCKKAQRKTRRRRKLNDDKMTKEFAQSPEKEEAQKMMEAAANTPNPDILQMAAMTQPMLDELMRSRGELRVHGDTLKTKFRTAREFVNLLNALKDYKTLLEEQGTFENVSEAVIDNLISNQCSLAKAAEEAHTGLRSAVELVNRTAVQVALMEEMLVRAETTLLQEICTKNDLSYAKALTSTCMFGNAPATAKAFVGKKHLHRPRHTPTPRRSKQTDEPFSTPVA